MKKEMGLYESLIGKRISGHCKSQHNGQLVVAFDDDTFVCYGHRITAFNDVLVDRQKLDAYAFGNAGLRLAGILRYDDT